MKLPPKIKRFTTENRKPRATLPLQYVDFILKHFDIFCRMKLRMLRKVLGAFISEKSTKDEIVGFAYNKYQADVNVVHLAKDGLSDSEITEKLWEHVEKTSSHSKEFARFFSENDD